MSQPTQEHDSPADRGHLAAVDVVRLITVVGVILVHSTSLANSHSSVAANALLQVFHVTRSVFLMLSAFVLTYSFSRRPARARSFWRRRYPLVLAPYVAWSALYVLAAGNFGSPLEVLARYGVDLLDAGAHFHLYFLLLTFQLYLVFPALMALVARWPGLLRPALWASGLFQVGFEAAVHYGWRPAVLSVWLEHPGSWLPSYTFYVVAGVAAATNLEALSTWVCQHYSWVVGTGLVALAGGLGGYLADIDWLGYSPLRASEVFQPLNAIEAVAFTVCLFALGLWWTKKLARRDLERLERASDVSFGVFLAHPMLLAALLALAAPLGLSAAVATLPSGIVELLIAAGLVPFVYLVTFWCVAALRVTPLSLWLTGRPRTPRRGGRGTVSPAGAAPQSPLLEPMPGSRACQSA